MVVHVPRFGGRGGGRIVGDAGGIEGVEGYGVNGVDGTAFSPKKTGRDAKSLGRAPLSQIIDSVIFAGFSGRAPLTARSRPKISRMMPASVIQPHSFTVFSSVGLTTIKIIPSEMSRKP